MLKVLKSIYNKPLSPYHASRIPNCKNCKHSLKKNGELVCKYFKYMPTTECRSTSDLCGKEGKYYCQLLKENNSSTYRGPIV